MESGRRAGQRVAFTRPIAVYLMGIDGTWRRSCEMNDISETGANVRVVGSIEGLSLKELFLLLSSTGLAYRRCSLAWVNGEQLGAWFLGKEPKKTRVELA